MSVKYVFLLIFFISCSDPISNNMGVDKDTDVTSDISFEEDLPEIKSACVSDFSSCEAGVTLVVGEDDAALIPFQAFSKFEDGTSLVFNLEGEAETLVGDIKLADGSKVRALPPMAGIVEPRENDEVNEIIWDTLGETIQVSFPRPDFMKITYDLELIDILKLDRPHRYLKGEFTAPISVRCYTGVPGSGEGVRDSDFSSEFCQKYIKHNHQFPPGDPTDNLP